MSIQVKLTWAEAELAAFAGMKRQLLALHDARPDYYGFNGEPWGGHIEAAGGELAVARHLGLYWPAWARRPAEIEADVGMDIQVRRRGQKGWNLILHPADRDDHRFVLVTGQIPDYEIHGWCFGREGKLDDNWGDPFSTGRPAFWVEQSALRPPEDLGAFALEDIPLFEGGA